MSLTSLENTQASWLYVWYDKDMGMDAAQGVVRQFFEQGSLSEHGGVIFHPVDPSWFENHKVHAGGQLAIDYCNHEKEPVAPRVKRELVSMESPLIAFTWKGTADSKDCLVAGLTVKLGSTDPYEVWGVKESFPPDRLEQLDSAERDIRREIEEDRELRETRVWCSSCHRMCYLMLRGSSVHFDDRWELAGILGITASVCRCCNAHICGDCLVALSRMEKAKQVCPYCGEADWEGQSSVREGSA